MSFNFCNVTIRTYVLWLTHPHFTEEESEVCERLSTLSEVIRLQSNKAKIWTPVAWLQSFSCWCLHSNSAWFLKQKAIKSRFQGPALSPKGIFEAGCLRREDSRNEVTNWQGWKVAKWSSSSMGKIKTDVQMPGERSVDQSWQRRAGLQSSTVVNQL